MKKMLASLVIIIALLTALIPCASAINGLYPLCGVIVEINYTDDIFYVIDSAGMEWALTECEDWQIGDIVGMIMFDNGTCTILDDIVVEYRYCGSSIDW